MVAVVAALAVFLTNRRDFRRLYFLVLTKSFILLASLAYVSASFNTLALFDCTRLPDGNYYLDADLGTRSACQGVVPALPNGVNARRGGMLYGALVAMLSSGSIGSALLCSGRAYVLFRLVGSQSCCA